MGRVSQVLEDMRASTPPVEPDIVTYSTLIKGFSASGNLDRALGLQREMRAEGKFMPDEMMYNSLLDGCAKEQRLSDALSLVEEMRKDHVRPSNYTLSMLVKLMGRCKRLGQAFSIIDQLTAEFGFRPNIQVYTCLMQACFQNRQPAKAVSLLDRIMDDGLWPDEKTYVALVRGHLHMGLLDKAVELVQRACQGSSPAGVDSRCLEDVVAKLGTRSELVKALRKQVEEVWRHRQVRGRQAALPSLRYKTKTTVRGGKGNGTALGSGRDGGACHVRSEAMAPRVTLAKQGKRTASSESRTSSSTTDAASSSCSTTTS
jgi:pentatricopeptide repeat protein